MRFDLHLREAVRSRLAEIADEMSEWEGAAQLSDDTAAKVRQSIRFFSHTTAVREIACAGIDGSGDFPSLAYGDCFVYLTVAQAALFASDITHGLRQIDAGVSTLFDAMWMPESEKRRVETWHNTFARMCGLPVSQVVAASDYQTIKAQFSGKRTAVDDLVSELILPNASDASNVAIQLRTTAELSLALRSIEAMSATVKGHRLLIFDSTLTLPLVTRRDVSLFYEHLKRLCCVAARKQDVALVGLSKSHGISGMAFLEEAACEVAGLPASAIAEHWFMRIPTDTTDGWSLSSTEGRRIPPAGAVSYLVRFHRTVPVLRVDLDATYCSQQLGDTSAETAFFEALDYCSHDQRCYGYPYPVKASHQGASLTEAERVAFRKQLIDQAVRAGLKRSLFRDASITTGHA